MMKRSWLVASALTGTLAVYSLLGGNGRNAAAWIPPPKPGDIGTAHPLAGRMSSPDGRWFVLCQARADTDGDGKIEVRYGLHYNDGDQALPYLVLGTGPGEVIDYPAAQSQRGEWLAVVRGGKLELIEAATYRRFTLPADVTNDRHWMRDKNARFVSIAADGSRMTYLRKDHGKDVIVIRELPSGTERTIAVNDKLWRATVDDSGRWAEVTVMRADTDHDGKIDWAGGPTSASLSECDTDPLHHRNPEGDQPTRLWLDLVAGTFVEDPTVIGIVGSELLHRTADGSLVLGTTKLAGASCHAQVEGVIASPPRVLVTCDPPKPAADDARQAPVVVAGPGIFRATRWKVYRMGFDAVYAHDRFARLDDTTYVDLTDGSELSLPGPQAHVLDGLALVNIHGEWAAFSLVKRTVTMLHERGQVGDVLRYGVSPIVPVGDSAYDLRTGKPIGPADDTIAFVDDHGRVLRSPASGAAPGYASPGPLRWDPP
jgi:hypothetical protein